MHGHAAGARECQGRQQRHAPVAQHAPHQARENQDGGRGRHQRHDAPGPHRLRHRGVERGNMAGGRDMRQRIRIEQTDRVQQPEEILHRQDGEVRGMIEIFLRQAVVENEGIVDDHEVHVGVAPVDGEIAEQEKGRDHAGDDGGKTAAPAKPAQPIERTAARADCCGRRNDPGAGGRDDGLVHGVIHGPRSIRRSFGQFNRLELGRQDDFQQFAVVGIVEDHVLDPWRLGPAAALAHRDLALAVELRPDPALEHVDHLEVDIVIVQLGDLRGIARPDQPDHVRLCQSVRRRRDAEVTILRVCAQAGGEVLVAMMADHETLR